MNIKNIDVKDRKKIYVIIILLVIALLGLVGTVYAFFNYTRTGSENVIRTGEIIFNYQDTSFINITNQYPITEDKLTDNNKLTFTITAYNTLSKGVSFRVYAVYGDPVNGYPTRFLDNTMKMKFVPAANADGINITTNNYAVATSPVFTNNQTLIAEGTVVGTTQTVTKSYSLYLWPDYNSAFVSSTVKRANNAEGNPSLADETAGKVNATRYMKNNDVATTEVLYPADNDSRNKIIYTTNEFSHSYYSIKMKIEATDIK